jgi:hypothetical protein
LLLLAALLGTASLALAVPLVSLDAAPDGTLRLVGNGWRPGQRLVVSVGPDLFAAVADSTGSFEVATGLTASAGPPATVSVRPQSRARLAFSSLGLPPQAAEPNAWAVLFAQGLATGAGIFGFSAAVLGAAVLARRTYRRRRPPG